MAIEKMKKLRLIAVSSQREELLRELMLLGCVEILEPSEEEGALSALTRYDGAELSRLKTEYAVLTNGVKQLDKFAPEKKKLLQPLPEAELMELLNERPIAGDLELAEKLNGLDEQIRRIAVEESRLRSVIESLIPWESLELSLDCKGTESAAVVLGSFPAAVDLAEADSSLAAASERAQIFRVSDDKNLHYTVLVALREELDEALMAVRQLGFAQMNFSDMKGTSRDCIAAAEKRLADLLREREALAAQIAAEAPHRPELKLRADTLATKIARAEASTRLMCTQSAFVFSGWLVAAREQQLAETLAKYDCAWETEDPDPDKPAEVPVKIRSNKLTAPYQMVTGMYSLPAYNGLDANPFVMPGFALFFGIMFADMAYGIIMLIAGILFLTKAKPRGGMKNLAGLLVQCGITTFIMGFLTGGFFGDAVSVVGGIFGQEWTLVPNFGAITVGDVVISLPLNLLEGNNPLYVLIAAMGIGVVHLAIGVGVGCYLKIRDGEWVDAIFNDLCWWVMFAGVALMVLGKGMILIYVGIAMLVIGNVLTKKGFGKVTGLFGAVYNGVTGYLGDILSYSRLMALMLAGSVIASVFNQLGALGGIFLFIPVFIIGHALNFGLNIIGCFVHTMRLQFLEFFGKWYRDGGRPFRPLEINTKYVTIKEDN